jgi:hypothetical protein
MYHLIRHDFIGHNLGYGLPLVSSASTKTQNPVMKENLRSYVHLGVLGFGFRSAAVEML